MTTIIQMICDSCIHKIPDRFVCTAFPTGIRLNPMKAQLHERPLPDQDNDVVYEMDPRLSDRREDFMAFRNSAIKLGLDTGEEDQPGDEPAEGDPAPPEAAEALEAAPDDAAEPERTDGP